MGDMPIGQCAVCEDDLDHEEAGYCEDCSQPFCWGYCGEWGDHGHECKNCRSEFGGDHG